MNCGQFELFSSITIWNIMIIEMTLSIFIAWKAYGLFSNRYSIHCFLLSIFSRTMSIIARIKGTTCKQNVNNSWMILIWLVKCKWNVLSRRSGKIMEIIFERKKPSFNWCYSNLNAAFFTHRFFFSLRCKLCPTGFVSYWNIIVYFLWRIKKSRSI